MISDTKTKQQENYIAANHTAFGISTASVYVNVFYKENIFLFNISFVFYLKEKNKQ